MMAGRPIGFSDVSLGLRADLRTPNARDDVSKGFAANDLWLSPDKRIYKCMRATASAAIWQRQLVPYVPAGGLGISGLKFAYAMMRVVPGYTGHAINVVRASDSTALDIDFLSNGKLDTETLWNFLAGTTGVIATIYDQSGNGYNATASTTFRPAMPPMPMSKEMPAWLHDNAISINGGSKIKQALTIPAGMTLARNSFSLAALVIPGHSNRRVPIVELSSAGGGGDTAVVLGQSDATSNYGLTTRFGGTNRLWGKFQPITPCFIGTTSGGSVIGYGPDDGTVTLSAVTAQNIAGGLIGGTTLLLDGSSDPDYGYLFQFALLGFSAALTSAQMEAIRIALYQQFDVAPQRKGIIVFDGDSITEGAWGSYIHSYPRRADALLSRYAKVYNIARGGGTMSTQTSAMSHATSQYYDASQPFNIWIESTGSNDLNNSDSAATIWANKLTYLSTLKSGGWSGKVLLGTILPRTSLSGQKEIERLALNATIRASAIAAGYDGIIDFASEPSMGAANANLDGTLYTDGTHPTPLGYSYNAAFAAETINAFITTTYGL